MTFELLQTLLDYHYWARDRLFVAMDTLTEEQVRRPLGNSFSSVFETVVHLYGADWIWRSRWEGESPMALPIRPPSAIMATRGSSRTSCKRFKAGLCR